MSLFISMAFLRHSFKNRLNLLIKSYCNATQEPIIMAHSIYGNINTVAQVVPPLIVMHCLFGSKRTWRSLCKKFSSDCRPKRSVISVDARNHGNSPHTYFHTYPLLAEDIHMFMKEHSIKKTSLLGHSMGGRAVMYFALKYPHLVEKVIVGDISPVSNNNEISHLGEIADTIQDIELPKSGISLSEAKQYIDDKLAMHFSNKSAREFFLTNLVENSDGSFRWLLNIPSLSRNMSDIINFPSIGDKEFDGPVLFAYGSESDYLRKEDFTDILRIFPNAEFKEIPHAGHWLYADNPQVFSKICLKFLNKN